MTSTYLYLALLTAGVVALVYGPKDIGPNKKLVLLWLTTAVLTLVFVVAMWIAPEETIRVLTWVPAK